MPLAARRAAAGNAWNYAMPSSRLAFVRGHRAPWSTRRPGSPSRRCCVPRAIATRVDNPDVPDQVEQEAVFVETEVGGQMPALASAVGRFDQALQHVECGCLDTVAEQELLTAGKAFHRRDEPRDEGMVRLQARARGTTVIRTRRGCSVRPRSRSAPRIPSTGEGAEKPTMGAAPPWNPREVRR